MTQNDHTALMEVFSFLGDILDGFDKHGREYATSYYLHVREKAPRPVRPAALHAGVAKLIRDEVMEQLTLDRRMGRHRAAA